MADNLAKALILLQDKNPARMVIDFCETAITILSNVVNHPTEEKYRRLKCRNATVQKKVLQCRGGDELFSSVGWRKAVYDMEEFLLYEGDDYNLLSAVIGKLQRLQTAVSASHAGTRRTNEDERQAVLQMVEEDKRARAERYSKAPVPPPPSGKAEDPLGVGQVLAARPNKRERSPP
eukprot:EG_transcript_32890